MTTQTALNAVRSYVHKGGIPSEDQMEVLLSKITDWDQLAKMRINAPSEFLASIEKRMVAVLKDLLPGITDWDRLVGMQILRRIGDESRQQRLIEKRMEAVLPNLLPKITDWDRLVEMWKRAPSYKSQAKQLIEKRVVAVLKDLLLKITDWDRLVEMWSNAFYDFQGLIEERMEVVLQEITDWDRLVEMRINAPPEFLDSIEKRMEAVLPNLLPGITDWDRLVRMWKSAPFNSRPKQLIEKRVEAVIRSVTLENMPSWFLCLMEGFEFLPPRLKFIVDEHARRLVQ